jgi:hypothetical protein
MVEVIVNDQNIFLARLGGFLISQDLRKVMKKRTAKNALDAQRRAKHLRDKERNRLEGHSDESMP